MLVLALLQHLTVGWVAAYRLIVIGLHNSLDDIHTAQFGKFAWLWMLLHERSKILLHGRSFVLVEYPVLLWTGIIALGYAFSAVVVKESRWRERWCL